MVKFILSYRAFRTEYFAADKLGILQVAKFLFAIIVNFLSSAKGNNWKFLLKKVSKKNGFIDFTNSVSLNFIIRNW